MLLVADEILYHTAFSATVWDFNMKFYSFI